MQTLSIKLPELKVNEQDPWSDDQLNRKECADKLTRILANESTALTIALNGEWGSGKTFMLKCWQQQLKNEGYTAIYFNAWEDDFLDSQLVAIIGQLWKELKGSPLEEICQAAKVSAVPLLRKVGVGLLNNGIKKVTGTDIAELAESELKTASESAFDNYTTLTECREDLKKRLQQLSNEVYNNAMLNEDKNEQEITKRPLIFIIDELDRCRPIFAIEVLEQVKHLFNIDHMIFVLGIDRKQLGLSIQAVYGNIDVENYLHRFVDLDFKLPMFSQAAFIKTLWKQYKLDEYLNEKSQEEQSDIKKEEGAGFKQRFIGLAQYHKLTLREIEQCFKMYSLLQNEAPLRSFTWPDLVVTLLILKLRYNQLYQDYIEGKCFPADIIEAILPRQSYSKQFDCDIIEAAIYASYMSDYPETDLEKGLSTLCQNLSAGKPIKDIPCVSIRLKEQTDERKLLRVAQLISSCRDDFGRSSRYGQNTKLYLGKMLDMLSFGLPEDRRE